MEYLHKSKNIFEKVYGVKHKLTGHAYNNLGDSYLNRKEPEKALEMFDRALWVLKENYGNTSVDVANCCLQMAKSHFELKEYEKVSEYLQNATEIYDMEQRGKDIDVTKTFNYIASIYMQMRSFDKAIELTNACIQLNKRNDREILSKSYDNLASSYSSINKLDEASEFYLKALPIKKEKYGEESLIVAGEYETIANCYFNSLRFLDAFEAFKKSYEIYEGLSADRDTKAKCCINIIDCLEALNLQEDAIKWYAKSLKLFERRNSEVCTAREIGLNHFRKRKFSLQNSYFEKYCEKEKAANEPKLLKASKMIAFYNAFIGKKEEAIEWIQKTDRGPLAYFSRTGIILWSSFVDYLKFSKEMSNF